MNHLSTNEFIDSSSNSLYFDYFERNLKKVNLHFHELIMTNWELYVTCLTNIVKNKTKKTNVDFTGM